MQDSATLGSLDPHERAPTGEITVAWEQPFLPPPARPSEPLRVEHSCLASYITPKICKKCTRIWSRCSWMSIKDVDGVPGAGVSPAAAAKEVAAASEAVSKAVRQLLFVRVVKVPGV